MSYIQGSNREQVKLLPDCLDDYVSDENPVRVIEAFVESLDLTSLGFMHSTPNKVGRPPYNPSDLLKLYIYGYLNRLRSSRRLEREAHINLELIWLLRDLKPDYRTIARYRRDHALVLKGVFRAFVDLCSSLNLYGRELIAIDGSKFKAVNSKDRNFSATKLKDRIKRIDKNIEDYLQALEESDTNEETPENMSADEIRAIISNLTSRKETYQSYLLDLKESGETQISTTDTDARLMFSNGTTLMGLNAQTAVDSKNHLIVDYEVTSDNNDFGMLAPMAISAAEILGVRNLSVVADNGYDSGTGIAECLREGIDVNVAGTDFDICIPVDHHDTLDIPEIANHQDGRCVYLRDRNLVLCPMGKVLYPRKYRKTTRKAVFSNQRECRLCKCRCTTAKYKEFGIVMQPTDFRKTYDDAGLTISQVRVKANNSLVRLRKTIVEHPFGTIKRYMDASYLLTRGLKQVRGELALSFLAYNIRRAINLIGVKGLLTALA
jgi:transposase